MQNKYERSGLPPDVASSLVKELRDLQQIADRANARMRQSIRGLLPSEIESAGLVQSIAQLVEEVNQALGGGPDDEPRCRLVIESRVTPHSYNQSMQLYRIVAEALSNARRHANPETIIVRIGSDSGDDVSQSGATAFVEIADDGVGMDPGASDNTKPGFGLRSMAIRAARANGKLSVQTEAGRGTVVRCDFTLTDERDNSPEEGSRIEFTAFDVNNESSSSFDDDSEADVRDEEASGISGF